MSVDLTELANGYLEMDDNLSPEESLTLMFNIYINVHRMQEK